MDKLMDFFQIYHSTDQHVCGQCKGKAAQNDKEANKGCSLKNMLLLAAKTLSAINMNLIPKVLVREITVKHTKVMDMTCCENPVTITIGITQTIASLLAHPSTVLETKPLEPEKLLALDAIVIVIAQSALLQSSQPQTW